MASTKKRHKSVLSDEHLKLLIEICAAHGSGEYAQKNPDFALGELLKQLNEDKENPTACVTVSLDWAVANLEDKKLYPFPEKPEPMPMDA